MFPIFFIKPKISILNYLLMIDQAFSNVLDFLCSILMPFMEKLAL